MSDTMTLNQVYSDDGLPMPNELLWQWVGREELDTPFKLVTVNPVEYVKQEAPGLRKSYMGVFKNGSSKEQKAHVKNLRKLARPLSLAMTTVMVLCDNQIIDGWHRMVAFALEGITEAKAIDMAEDS